MAAKTSAAKKKAGSGGRSAKKTTSGVKAVHSTKPSSRTTSKTTAHKKNGVAPGRIHIVDARLKK